MRKRFWIEVGFACLSAVLLVLTLANAGWIEVLVGVDPDHGDGSLEWQFQILAVVAMFTVLRAREAGMDLRAKRRSRCQECGAVVRDGEFGAT